MRELYISYSPRLEHLPENAIGIIPNRGVDRQKTHSVEALSWLEWVSFSEHIEIRHARNRAAGDRGGERRIGKRSLDGNYCVMLTTFSHVFHDITLIPPT